MQLDREDEEKNMCPVCVEESKQKKCIKCGKNLDMFEDEGNPNFDLDKFEKLKSGE